MRAGVIPPAPGDDQSARQQVLAVLPERRWEVARLARLGAADGHATPPVVAVVGKYNHGKSRLLNELLGLEAFAVADRRETVALADQVRHGVRWMDAPGLDADIASADDALAEEAMWLHADVRLFVHAAKEGELDETERQLLAQLMQDARCSQRQTLLVLSQIDQLADEAALCSVQAALQSQLDVYGDSVAVHAVSATRHGRGVQECKSLLVQRSGIPGLKAAIAQAAGIVPAARRHEHAALYDALSDECRRHRDAAETGLSGLQGMQRQQYQAFETSLGLMLDKVGQELETLLAGVGADQALEPDSFANMFKSTAGKRERARLQIAYSKACIAIDSVLNQHGVTSLPPEQCIEVKSLNSVIVAVLGVSVKYRDDLRRIFLQAAGRERLLQEFGRYFRLSEDQRALAERIAQCEAALSACSQAMAALQTWAARP